MTTTNAELLLSSLNSETGDILHTWALTLPRIVLPEINTHRVLSRNTSSSRAIPGWKQRRRVWEDPFVPEYIGVNRSGMQAGEELTGWRRSVAVRLWRGSRLPALGAHWLAEKIGVHKQIMNRLIEPWTFTVQVVSGTEWDNFFLQRDHKDAEPHFHKLAAEMHRKVNQVRNLFKIMKDGYWRGADWVESASVGRCQILRPGQWHLPFVLEQEEGFPLQTRKQISAARCARTSYTLPDTNRTSTVERDIELFNRLAGSNPKHLSPLEHQAVALPHSEYVGNFKGFKQFRKEIPGENGIIMAA